MNKKMEYDITIESIQPDCIEELTNRKIIKLSNRLCKANFDIKEVSLNVFITLLTEITREDNVLREFDISLLQLEKKMNKKLNRKAKYLDTLCKDLVGNNISLYGENELISLCSKCELIKEDGAWFLQVKINPVLEEELLNLSTEFTKLNLNSLLAINGGYAKQMYMLLKSFAGLEFWKADLNMLHEVLQVPNSYIEKFYTFRSKVLNPCLEVLNKPDNEEINVSYTVDKKSSKRVKVLNFKIKKIEKTVKNTNKLKKKKKVGNLDNEEWAIAIREAKEEERMKREQQSVVDKDN